METDDTDLFGADAHVNTRKNIFQSVGSVAQLKGSVLVPNLNTVLLKSIGGSSNRTLVTEA